MAWGSVKKRTLHLVAEVVWIQTFEPPLQAFAVSLVGRDIHTARAIKHLGLDEDRSRRANRQRQGVAGTRVDEEPLSGAVDLEVGEERPVLEVGDDHAHEDAAKILQQIL